MTTAATVSPPPVRRSPANVVVLWILWLIALAPAVVPLYVIVRDGVDVRFLDQWDHEILDVSLAARQGHVSPYLFQQHNEHRVFVPKLVYMLIDPLSRGNVKVQMTAEWVVVLGTSLVVLGLIRTATGAAGRRPVGAALLWLACNLLIFSPVQLENWLWGIGLMNVFPMAFIATLLLMLHGNPVRPWRLTVAIIAASAATFSSGNGTLAWLLGAVVIAGPMLIRSPDPHLTRQRVGQRLRLLGVWFAAMSVNAALFIHGYHNMAQAQQEMYHANLPTMVVYTLAFLGSPFAFLATGQFATASAYFGVALLIPTTLLLARWVRQRRGDPQPALDLLLWGCVASFTLLSALMAARTRAGFGIEQAITSRYTSFAIYLPIGLIGAAGVLLGQRPIGRVQRRVAVVGVLVIAMLSIAAYPDALRRSDVTRIIRLQAKAAMLMLHPLPDNPQFANLLYPTTDILQEQANALNAAGWLRPRLIETTDARRLAMSAPPPPEDVGRVEHVFAIDAKSLGVSGWALLPGRRTPADAVFVSCQAGGGPDVPVAMGQIRVFRPDVARRFGDDCQICGWTAVVPTAKLLSMTGPRALTLRLHGWSLNVTTARAARLGGDVPVPWPR